MLTLRLSGLVTNPFESPCGNQAYHQKIVSAKAGRVLPVASIFVRALKGDIEHTALVRLLTPDTRTDEAVTDFVNRLVIGFIGRLVFHNVFLFIGLTVNGKIVSSMSGTA